MKVYFLILHYQAIQETISCVESILQLYDNISIVVIDNNSPNKSGRELEERYREYENIKIIITKGNLGFARGNNVGYEYAKSQGADFIIQVNNDTLFEDKNFVKTMLQLYEKEKYAVLIPFL